MGDKGNSATAEKVLGEGVGKSWVAVIRHSYNGVVEGIPLRVDFTLGVAVASSQRDRERKTELVQDTEGLQ